jgi:hypothetical protein
MMYNAYFWVDVKPMDWRMAEAVSKPTRIIDWETSHEAGKWKGIREKNENFG